MLCKFFTWVQQLAYLWPTQTAAWSTANIMPNLTALPQEVISKLQPRTWRACPHHGRLAYVAIACQACVLAVTSLLAMRLQNYEGTRRCSVGCLQVLEVVVAKLPQCKAVQLQRLSR